MKTKLTLTVSERTIQKARRQSKKNGKSLSRMFEELFEKDDTAPLKTQSQHAAERLLKQLEKSRSVKTLDDKEMLRRHLTKKYA